MDAIAVTIERFTQFVLTEAVCVGCVVIALVGLVVVSLVVEACDTIPERGKKRTRSDKSQKPPLLLF